MEQYKIYCTPEQTKKALELGAPIRVETKHVGGFIMGLSHIEKQYISPTAEQMIGWLEEQEAIEQIVIVHYDNGWKWGYIIYLSEDSKIEIEHYNSRKEATLAAIDVALDYLIENKK